jgi:hypothetical protein
LAEPLRAPMEKLPEAGATAEEVVNRPDSRLKGHLVLITGRFDGRSRADIENLVLSSGGTVQKSGQNSSYSTGSNLVSVVLS